MSENFLKEKSSPKNDELVAQEQKAYARCSCATKVNTIVETTKYADKTRRKDTDTADE